MRMRINHRLLQAILFFLAIFTIVTYIIRCGDTSRGRTDHLVPATSKSDINIFDDSNDHDYLGDEHEPPPLAEAPRIRTRGGLKTLDDIECLINDEYTVSCKQEDGEVYVPFTFLREYFEVNGKVVKRNGEERFEWQHSYSKVYYPRGRYDPHGIYMWFENYHVEVRDRVLCISGVEGVPISTQWDSHGHFYPIQIAQFGLSHFSKNLTEKSPSTTLVDGGEKPPLAQWTMSTIGKTRIPLKRVLDEATNRKVLEFKTDGSETDPGLTLTLETDSTDTTLAFDLRMVASVTVTVVIIGGKRSIYRLHYVMTDSLISAQDNEVFLGIGTSKDWTKVTRDLVVDLQKGLMLTKGSKKKSKLRSARVHSITLQGWGYVDNITLSSSAHMAHFFAVANWFVHHQDENGGWPIMVIRRLSPGMADLAPGWYSAMGQGQAISVLTRAFNVTGNLTYLHSAMNAIEPFKVRSENHGVMTTFAGKYIWYEEYPTTPSSYVLNGFIYSLIGLYDLKMTCTHKDCKTASKLYEDGMVSLKKMLPLFDTGSGSAYDLRHFSLGGVAPNLARWDYHTTHINQLMLLSTFNSDPIFKTTANRWIDYMKGKRAAHN